MKVLNQIRMWLATGFGLGLFVPFAPGTFGSLPGVALAYGISVLPLYLQLPVCLALTLLAIPICEYAEQVLGIHDDGRIVADEWMLFPIALIGMPLTTLPWWSMLIFFAVVRFFDIVKLPPAECLQAIPGGRGIVIDDFIANLYSLAVNWLIFVLLFS